MVSYWSPVVSTLWSHSGPQWSPLAVSLWSPVVSKWFYCGLAVVPIGLIVVSLWSQWSPVVLLWSCSGPHLSHMVPSGTQWSHSGLSVVKQWSHLLSSAAYTCTSLLTETFVCSGSYQAASCSTGGGCVGQRDNCTRNIPFSNALCWTH